MKIKFLEKEIEVTKKFLQRASIVGTDLKLRLMIFLLVFFVITHLLRQENLTFQNLQGFAI